jgi:uncharacterized protein YndB with AHSA1/START domain
MAAPSDDLTLRLEPVLPAPRALVFRALGDADEVARWWGPAGFTVPSLDFASSVGRPYRIRMQPPDGDAFELTGEFRAVDPPARLAYTFTWEPPDPDDVEPLVDLSLDERGGTTDVVLDQGRFKTGEPLGLHRDAWTESFDTLERLLAARG